MEASMQNINLTIPVADMKFFKELVKKMGWTIEHNNKRNMANPVTLAAIEEARTEEAAGTMDTSSYDAFVKSILQ